MIQSNFKKGGFTHSTIMIHWSFPASPPPSYMNMHVSTGCDMSNAKTGHAVPKSHVLFRQAFNSPCWEECGIKQRQDGGRRWEEELGCSCGNWQGSKHRLVFQGVQDSCICES